MNPIKIYQVTQNEYDKISIKLPIFLKAAYTEHYKVKVEEVFHFVIKGKNFCIGITGGVKENAFFSPFSAPYGGFSILETNYSHIKFNEGLKLFEHELKSKLINEIKIVQPPDFINPANIFIHNALKFNNYNLDHLELNQFINLNKYDNPSEYFKKSARNKFNQLRKLNLEFIHDNSLLKEAYDLIKESRKIRNKPLKMKFEELEHANKLTNLEVFLLKYQENYISACIGFKCNTKLFHVIYWGHNVRYEELFPMNGLSYFLINSLKNKGYEYIDLGISTNQTSPDYGLLNFKISIGAETCTRLSWTKRIN